VGAGAEYKFYVVGQGSKGYKRDPYAREVIAPDWNCVVSDAVGYPWHDADFQPPRFEDLIIYQFHVGTFYAVDQAGHDRRQGRSARFLDVLDRLEYLAELGVMGAIILRPSSTTPFLPRGWRPISRVQMRSWRRKARSP